MAAIQEVIKEILDEWKLERDKYRSQIQHLQEENNSLRKKKRKNKIFPCLGKKKKKYESPGNTGLSSADEEQLQDFQDSISEKFNRIGALYDDLKVRHLDALQKLEEEKRCSNQLKLTIQELQSKSRSYRAGHSSSPSGLRSSETSNAHYNQLDRSGQNKSSPQVRTRVTEARNNLNINEIPYFCKASDDKKKRYNRQSCVFTDRESTINTSMIRSRTKEVPRSAKGKKCKEMTKDVKLTLEADRERLRLEMKVAAVEIAERNELIGYFRDHLKSYNEMFYLLGGLIFVNGLLWLLEPALARRKVKRTQPLIG